MANQQKLSTISSVQVTPTFRLPNADSTAEHIIDQAFSYCAQKLGLNDAQAALAQLKQGDKTACQYCTYSIAQQVGLAIGSLDDNVQSVFVFDYDATPNDRCFAAERASLPIHILVLTARKTHALDAFTTALDQSLIRHYQSLVGMNTMHHLLDVQMVDGDEVEKRVGYGAMLTSIHQRPIQVWSR